MGRPPLLYLAPDGLHCYRRHRHATEHCGHFPTDATGLEAFSGWLHGLSTATPFTLLVDLPDERFRIETLPHVRGPDRRRLRERRQAQLFPDTPFVAHQYLDREPSGRQDERILFATPGRPSTITPWLEAIEGHGHRLQRLVPAAFLAAALAAHLPATQGPLLLALLTPAGLRISCCEGRKLLFSRLSPASQTEPPPLSQWQDEAREVHRHLLNQRILRHDMACTCHLLTPANSNTSTTSDAVITPGELRFAHSAPPSSLASPHHARPTDGDDRLLLLRQPCHHARLPHATPAAALHAGRLHLAGQLMVAGTAMVLVLCMLLTVSNMMETQTLEQRGAAATARGDAIERALVALQAASPSPAHPLPRLQATLDMLQRLEAETASPEPALHQLADALAPLPDAALKRIEWTANGTTGPENAAPSRTQGLDLHFALPDGLARERVNHAQRLLAALSSIPGIKLHTERLPVEMTGSRSLSPAILDAEGSTSALRVHLEIPAVQP
ncbi:MAG: hypothetical protein JSR69_11400 [Proteobacteria bacterium]|nr:hypothetical protein [Pseudomonadota bacterium]